MHALPLSLFSRILEFAICNFTPDLGPSRRFLSKDELKNLAHVSKQWYQAVNELLAQFQRDTMQLTFKFGSKNEIMAVRRQILLRGRAVRDLRVRMGLSYGTEFVSGTGWWMETQNISWNVIFSQLPGLKRLDLSSLPLESRHLPLLLEMAATFCLQLEMLILPGKRDMTIVKNAAVTSVMEILSGALQRWFKKGRCGGLKQLTVPTREEEHRFLSSTKFIQDVINFCPNIEYVDGYYHVNNTISDMTCDEQWMISIDTWKKFNKTCTKLRDFHWLVVPFTKPFFRIFGEHVKPKLKKLTLASNQSWDWNEYFKNINQSLSDCLLGNDIVLLLPACPALTELRIVFDQEKKNESVVLLLNLDVFGDDFWMAVVHYCPLLQSVYVHDYSVFSFRDVKPIQTFTDRGLLALADHLQLSSVELPLVCCTGNGVFEYIRHAFKKKKISAGKCSLDLRLAGPNDDNASLANPFYVELITLLGRLAAVSEKDLGVTSCSHKISINVINQHISSVGKEWSKGYLRDELEPVLEKVAKLHSKLSMHVDLSRKTDGSFRCIYKLELDWCSGLQEEDMFSEDEFVDCSDSNVRESDEDEEFDLWRLVDDDDEFIYIDED